MGMYTKITATITVKPDALPIVSAVCNGEDWKDVAIKFPWLKEWSEFRRANFIPRGTPCEWSLSGNVWDFECSLKNYNGEIEYFFANVLPRLAESVELLETKYEEDRFTKEYTLENGAIVQKECAEDEHWEQRQYP